ncbi:hypothetical protein PtB15_16B145 [Puccinia triticina]|nr:hypothetical protein PtB15_16B145 [Puccinia triticina]
MADDPRPGTAAILISPPLDRASSPAESSTLRLSSRRSSSSRFSLRHSPNPATPPNTTTSPTPNTASTNRLSSAMKSLFNRKPSITSSSGSSFSNTSSHYSRRPIPTDPSRDQPEPDNDRDLITDNCPVCIEDLRMNLIGEKPLVIPKCGHRLHASCFEAVYGPLDEARRTGAVLGLCGICRKDMRLVASGAASKKTLDLNRSKIKIPPPSTATHKIHSITRKTLPTTDMIDEDSDDDEDVQPSESELEREDELLGSWNELDQPGLLHPGGIESLRIEHKRQQTAKKPPILKPTLTLLAENPNLFLNKDSDKSQHLTCMLSIQLPSAYAPAQPAYPTPLSPTGLPSDIHHHGSPFPGRSASVAPMSPPPSSGSRSILLSPATSQHPHDKTRPADRNGILKSPITRENSITFIPPLPVHHDHLPPLPVDGSPRHSLQPVLDDLLDRMQDWKGHSSKDFGVLQKYDQLYVEKEANCRQFLVYLFEEALLCVSAVQRDSITQGWTQQDGPYPNSGRPAPPLKLKGRVYIRHMHSVSVIPNDASNVYFLRVKMKDEKMDAFTMRFDDLGQLEDWHSHINALIHKRNNPVADPSPLQAPFRMREMDHSTPIGIPSTPLSLPPTPVTTNYPGVGPALDRDSLRIAANSTRSSRSDSLQSACDSRNNDGGTASSLMSGSTKTTLVTSISTLSSVGEEYTEGSCPDNNPSFSNPFQTDQQQQQHPFSFRDVPSLQTNPAFRSASLRHDFRPIDLALVISIPFPEPSGSPSSSSSSSTSLKLRLLKQSLQFVVYHLHPRSRLSLVAFTVGTNNNGGGGGAARGQGQLLYTPFLTVGKAASLKRVEFAIEQLARSGRTEGILTAQNWKYFGEDIVVAQQAEDCANGFAGLAVADDPRSVQDRVQRRLRMLERHEDKVSVVTAVNLAYDMILPRKQKNPLSGIMLLNDSRDCSTKPEMTLVMTRAEAIQIPIQSIGWGESHNPSSLWQLSNHTGGTYSFVRDHQSIKEAIAGCVGGMLSVGMSNARVSIGIAEPKWFKMKKVSGITHVISSDGQHADLELGQLRFGERRDVLVEVEMRSAREVYRTQSRRSRDGDQALLGLTGPAPIETGTDAFFRSQLGGDAHLGMMGEMDAFTRFYEAQFDDMNDDMGLLEVNVTYRDVQAGKNLLTSDSLSRVLLLVSRRMDGQGLRLMHESRRIVATLLTNLFHLDPGSTEAVVGRRALALLDGSVRQALAPDHAETFVVLAGCLQVLQRMIEGLDELRRGLSELVHPSPGGRAHEEGLRAQLYARFEAGMRNFAAEQAGILRDQKAWLVHPASAPLLPSSVPGTPGASQPSFGPLSPSRPLPDAHTSVLEETYFRADFAVWMRNMMEHWMPERY